MKSTPVVTPIDCLSLRLTLAAAAVAVVVAVASERIAFGGGGALRSMCSRSEIETREEDIEGVRKEDTKK